MQKEVTLLNTLPYEIREIAKKTFEHLKGKKFSELTKNSKKNLKEILEKLYWNYNLSLRKIALLFGRDYDTIYNWFIKLKIKKKSLLEAAKLRRNPDRKFLFDLLPQNLQLKIKRCRKEIKPRKINIPSQLLKQLYVDQKLGAYKIGILFGVSRTTINKLLQKFEIKARRSIQKRIIDKKKRNILQKRVSPHVRKIINKIHREFEKKKSLGLLFSSEKIPKEILEYLYLKHKLSLSKISILFGLGTAKIQKRLEKYNIPRRSVSEALTKYPKKPFVENSREMTKLKCYLLGLRCGDLHALLDDKRVICSISTTHPAWEKLMGNLFIKFGPIKKHPFENRKGEFAWNISAYLDNSFSFLLRKLPSIPFWILSDQELFLNFLAGLIDSEGCITLDTYNTYLRFKINISLTDKDLLKNIEKGIKNLGFSSIFYVRKIDSSHFGKKPIWNLNVQRKEEVKRLLNLLFPFLKHEEKIIKTRFVLKSDNKSVEEIKRKWDILSARIEKSVAEYKKLAKISINSKLS